MIINEDKFNELKYNGQCDCCGKETDVIEVSGNFGPLTYSVCYDCLEKELQPYNYMVAYISEAGNYPEDISKTYVKLIRDILIKYGKTEEEFKYDIKIMQLTSIEILQEIVSLVGSGKYHTGKFIKDLVWQYMNKQKEDIYNEVVEFYEDYVEGKDFFPIADNANYKLDWLHGSIVPISE